MIIHAWNSVNQAAKKLDIGKERIICAASKNCKSKTAYNYIWTFDPTDIPILSKHKAIGINNHQSKPVYQLNPLTGKVIKKWDYVKQAANFLKLSPAGISQSASPNYNRKSCGNFNWSY